MSDPSIARWQTLFSGLCFAAAFMLIVLWGLNAFSVTPVHIQYTDNGVVVDLHANRDQVLLPGDCVTVEWTASGVQGVAFFPTVRPGFNGAPGVRQTIAGADFDTLPPEAPGAIITLADEREIISGSERACINLNSSPKLRIYLDGSAPVIQTRIDMVFLRLETWLIFGAAALLLISSDLLRVRSHPQMTYTLIRAGLIASTVLLAFYAWVFLEFGLGRFLGVYWLDVVPLAMVIAANFWLFFTYLRGTRRCLSQWVRLRRWLRGQPLILVWIGVVVFWGWVLAFAFNGQHTLSEYIWLPFLLWAVAWGIAIIQLRGYVVDEVVMLPSTNPKVTHARLLAITFFFLAIVINIFLLWGYGFLPGEDASSYLNPAAQLMNFDSSVTSETLPRRTFPLLLTFWITGSPDNPTLLAFIQISLAAVAIAALTYVLAHRSLLLAATIGVLLAANQTWALYSRQIMSESLFVSFVTIGLAGILAHYSRRENLPLWQVVAVGMVLAWGLLMRSALVIMLIPLGLIYIWRTRSWRHGVALLMGAAIILGTVIGFNTWRYDNSGLIGPQYDTLVSALLSYPGFDPEAGPVSAEIHEEMQVCMPYLDYDEAPRYNNPFIYQHFNQCFLTDQGTYMLTPAELDERVNAAFRERVLDAPFTYARLLVEETGTLLSFALVQELEPLMVGDAFVCIGFDWCDDISSANLPSDQPLVRNANLLAAIPTQAYLAGTALSSRSGAVSLGAFLMWMVFLSLAAPRQLRFMVAICLSSIIVIVGSILIVHTFKPRYTVILLPFYAVLSGITVLILWQWSVAAWRSKRHATLAVLGLLILGYGFFAQPDLRRAVTLPLSAAVLPDTNLFEKYNFSDEEYQLTATLSDHPRAFAVGSVDTFSDIYRAHMIDIAPDLSFAQRYALRGWEFTREPGFLRDMGYSMLLISPEMWAAFPPDDQAKLDDATRYNRVGNTGDYRLYTVVGEQRDVYAAYDANDLVIFTSGDGAFDVYSLDENRNGVLLVRIDQSALTRGENQISTQNDWEMTVRCGVSQCDLALVSPDGQSVPIDFAFPLVD